MEELLNQLIEGQKQLLEKVNSIDNRLGNVEGRLGNVEGQLTETNDIVKALMHRSEELDAKMNELAINTVSKEAIERIESNMSTQKDLFNIADDVSFLVRKAAEQDLAIRKLRKAE